jgi:hemolysin type calcium-binding protein
MRLRALLIVAIMLLGVMMLSGVALAVTKTCTTTNPCVGTNGPDKLTGTDGANQIRGLGGPDSITGGGSNDTISVADGYEDDVSCGEGTDTVYVDELDVVNADCEEVTPGNDTVYGTGKLGEEMGSPHLNVTAESTGTNSDDAQGQFSITYPDGTEVQGTIVCLAITSNEARLVAQIESASGPGAEGGTFVEGAYVRIGVLDNATDDQASFSTGEQTFTTCNGETPNSEVVEGNFIVADV